MNGSTTITVVGNVATEPELRLTGAGTRVVSFRLAVTERRYDKALQGWRDGDTVFWTVTCWRNTGDNVVDSVKKGEPMLVHGRLRIRGYDTKDGGRGSSHEIEAQALGHDISRGVSRFTKASFQPGQRDLVPEDDELVDDGEERGPLGTPADSSAA